MAQASTMIDVVVAKALTDQFLEQVGFFVGAFGASEACNGLAASGIAQPAKTGCGGRHRLFPCRFPKHVAPIAGIDIQALGGRPGGAGEIAARTAKVVLAPACRAAQPCGAADLHTWHGAVLSTSSARACRTTHARPQATELCGHTTAGVA